MIDIQVSMNYNCPMDKFICYLSKEHCFMDNLKEEKLSEIASKLIGMSFVLNSYCEYYENIEELGNLVEFSAIMHKTSKELFDLL